MPRFRKSPRIKDFDYTGWFAYSVTLVTRRRLPILRDERAVNLVLEALDRSLSRHGFTLHAYCFMPEHLQLLRAPSALSGTSRRHPASSPVTALRHRRQQLVSIAPPAPPRPTR